MFYYFLMPHIKQSITIKSHFSANDENTDLQTSAMYGIEQLAKHYDEEAASVTRASTHKRVLDTEGMVQIMQDFRSIRPFVHIEGRRFINWPNIPKSKKYQVDGFKLNMWFNHHKPLITL